MKKALIVFAILCTVAFTTTSCKKEKKEEVKKEMVTKLYQCPMDCEHGKSYTEVGKCPVCKMDLKEKKPGDKMENKKEHKEGDDHKH